jgi:hypothetical protein
MSNNFPMRGGKNTLWEGGTRVNGIVRGPGLQQVGGTSSVKMHATDWLRTLVKMASGQELEAFIPPGEPPYLLGDGLDVWDALRTGDQSRSARDWMLLETHPRDADDRVHGDAFIEGDWKILSWTYSPEEENLWHPPPGQDPDTTPYLFSCGPPPDPLPSNKTQCAKAGGGPPTAADFCLFNITADPCEHHDLSAQHPDVVQALLTRLYDFMDSAVPELVESGPVPIKVLMDDDETLVWAPVDGPCLSDNHCSRNGACSADTGLCACSPGWTGPRCAQFDALPTDPADGFNDLAAGISSWGGSVVFAEEDNLFHLFYSSILGVGCTLAQWETNSACFHATSTSPQGPFANESMVLGAFCHNAIIRRAADKTFLLYHIGDAAEPSGVVNCTGEVPPPSAPLRAGSIGFNTLSYSTSVWGPWTPLGYSILNGSGVGGDWDNTITNLAPWPMPDGSVLTAFRGKNNVDHVEQIGIASAPSWRGPYAPLSAKPLFADSEFNATGEDPFLYVSNGTVHIIFHVCCPGVKVNGTLDTTIVAAHAFAPMGKNLGKGSNWYLSPEQPYSLNVTYANGTLATVARRERPQLYFDPDSGAPRVLTTGVVPQHASSASFTMATGIAAR